MNGQLLLLNGPNLNMLGERETDIYGNFSLQDIEWMIIEVAKQHDCTIHSFQSNHEGALIDRLHEANGQYKGIIFNPGAYSHTSIALHDAIKAIETPVIEVHMSNIFDREAFRRTSVIAPACVGQVVGLGVLSYKLATLAFLNETTIV